MLEICLNMSHCRFSAPVSHVVNDASSALCLNYYLLLMFILITVTKFVVVYITRCHETKWCEIYPQKWYEIYVA